MKELTKHHPVSKLSSCKVDQKGEIAFKSMNVDLSASIACAAQTFISENFWPGTKRQEKQKQYHQHGQKIISFV